MRQGPGFVPRSPVSARSSSGGGVHRAGSNPSEELERSYDWSYMRSPIIPPSRPSLRPCPWAKSSILNPGKAMWALRNAYVSCSSKLPIVFAEVLAGRQHAQTKRHDGGVPEMPVSRQDDGCTSGQGAVDIRVVLGIIEEGPKTEPWLNQLSVSGHSRIPGRPLARRRTTRPRSTSL
jgi:hypothetical protein